MKKPLRRCQICDIVGKQSIDLENDKCLIYNNKFYHYDCFVSKLVSKNKDPNSKEKAIIKADELYENSRESIQIKLDRDKLSYWLYDNYNLNTLPNSFFTKISEINSGTFYRIKDGISYYDLLQIFIKMKSHLDKIHGKRERKSQHMSAIDRVHYDLGIVLNNYDKYLEWKSKQKAENTEKQELLEEIKTKNELKENNTQIRKQHKHNDLNDDCSINIANLLDEVF